MLNHYRSVLLGNGCVPAVFRSGLCYPACRCAVAPEQAERDLCPRGFANGPDLSDGVLKRAFSAALSHSSTEASFHNCRMDAVKSGRSTSDQDELK